MTNRITKTYDGFEIDGIKINEDIFDEDLSEYKIIAREDEIDSLINRIAESNKESDIFLMKEDLKLLMSMDEEYILSSIETNNYLDSKTKDYYNHCNNILELNKE